MFLQISNFLGMITVVEDEITGMNGVLGR